MKDHNHIGKDVKDLNEWDLEVLGWPKAEGWLPFYTYDMVQCGYPYPDHGEMIIRENGGVNDAGELLPPNGMWCKVKDVIPLLAKNNMYEICDAIVQLERMGYKWLVDFGYDNAVEILKQKKK